MTDHDSLIEGLRNWADGSPTDRAAVEMLITHQEWLTRADFVSQCIEIIPTEDLFEPDRPVALIDWQAVAHSLEQRTLPAASSATGMLAVAASMGTGHPVNLRDVLCGLDANNTAAVATAVVTAAQADDRVEVIS